MMGKIIPFEKMHYEDGQIAVDEAQITYVQNSDCTESEEEVQSITLSARNNGVARFVNIKTEGWSIDSPEELVMIIKDFMQRADIEEDKIDIPENLTEKE